MKAQTKTFLQFNGKTIYFLDIKGEYWVSVKPICEAIGVNYNRQFQNLKSHPIFGGVFAKQQMHDASGRLQNMIALPERYVYGWIFQIRSDNQELIQYQKDCCDLLFNYFHGTITQRKHILRRKSEIKMEMHQLRENLAVSEDFHRLMELTTEEMRLGKSLKELDAEIVKDQLSLFNKES